MQLAQMIFYVVLNTITPGPNNLMCMYLAAANGLRGARKFMVGSMGTFIIKTFLCGVLNLALAAMIPALIPYLKWLGAAYMLYLAYTMLKKGFRQGGSAKTDTGGESTYRSGVLLQVLNMKSWVMGLSVYSIYVIPYTADFGSILLTTAICGALMTTSSLMWALFGKAAQRVYERYIKAFSVVMALSLVYCAVMAVM